MDLTSQLLEHIWWVIPLMIISAILKSPSFKGFAGEIYIRNSAKYFLDKSTYHAVHNVTLATPDGTTQIDHIFVSEYGVFVVETKNYSGWIFGDEKQSMWTQKLYKKTYKFQNPLHQNYKHLKALESSLSISSDKFHSVIIFVGGSTFKTRPPPNVRTAATFISYIKSKKVPILSLTEVQNILRIIQTERLSPSFNTHREHVNNLQARFNTASPRLCPKCGSKMVLRTTKAGENAGKQFWGCSQFPKCRLKMQTSNSAEIQNTHNVVPFRRPSQDN
ncbi:nuclease-related domain-containing protein [Methylotenera sp. G11]|uniref:nuclease-related domain-containing protein n=1 Tax=Methylotenera sp. G11 TaxID=1506585 RepID=UPI0009DE557A|nr:NERD domain-containing protein [Methylotenera sp. G11]